jgi:hypothetical protein
MKTTKTALRAATDSLNWLRDHVSGGTRDETRKQFEGGSGDRILAAAAEVEELTKNPSKRVDEWTLDFAKGSVERSRNWVAAKSVEYAEPAAPDAPKITFGEADAATVIDVLIDAGFTRDALLGMEDERILTEYKALLRRATFSLVA